MFPTFFNCCVCGLCLTRSLLMLYNFSLLIDYLLHMCTSQFLSLARHPIMVMKIWCSDQSVITLQIAWSTHDYCTMLHFAAIASLLGCPCLRHSVAVAVPLLSFLNLEVSALPTVHLTYHNHMLYRFLTLRLVPTHMLFAHVDSFPSIL